MSNTSNYEDLYMLKKDVPGFEKGTIFQHREYNEQRDLGSPSGGYLTNIYINGDCQESANHVGWCAGTHIFPGQVKDDTEWFAPVKMMGKAHAKVHHVKGLLFEEQL